MPLPTETGSKKYIVAEGFFDSNVSEGLCNLFVSDLKQFRVLSIYSDLSKKLLAYKIMLQDTQATDIWLSTQFLKTIHVDFNPHVELIPRKFSDSINYQQIPFSVQPESIVGFLHYANGLFLFNQSLNEQSRIFLFKQDDSLSIYLFSGKNIVFSNTFECHNETEILYYTLNSLQVSNIKQDDTTIYLDFGLASDDAFTAFIKSYFNSVQNMKADISNPDTEIPFLLELLFPNHLLSLCV